METIGNKKALRVSNHFHCRTGLARSDKGISLFPPSVVQTSLVLRKQGFARGNTLQQLLPPLAGGHFTPSVASVLEAPDKVAEKSVLVEVELPRYWHFS
jgi:hypothetical protein